MSTEGPGECVQVQAGTFSEVITEKHALMEMALLNQWLQRHN